MKELVKKIMETIEEIGAMAADYNQAQAQCGM